MCRWRAAARQPLGCCYSSKLDSAGRNPGETEFQQAVQEVAEHAVINDHPAMEQAKILERITEPGRMIVFWVFWVFRVCWEDDSVEIQVNRGYRVQY